LNVKEALTNSIEGVARWVEDHQYRAYDPGDGDLSFLRYATGNVQIFRQILTATVLRSPFHIRPWIGIKPHTSTKGMGYMGWGYLKMYKATGDESYRHRAESCFAWLIENRSPGHPQHCWGNAFSFSTRAGTIPRYTPTIVWSSLIGLAFVEAYEVLKNPQYLEVAASASEWVKCLPREQTSSGTCLSYVPFRQSSIHNSNMLGGALLARTAAHTRDREAVALAREAMVYSCSRQNDDGAWFYGSEPKYHWIDNFHTGYNLDCLKRYIDSTSDSGFQSNLQRGFQYFKDNFFKSNGCPKYYHNNAQPTDIQCAAQAIDTLSFLSDLDPSSLELAQKVAAWTIQNMQSKDGHFYYRDLGWKKVKTPMLHWGQGTTFKALAHLLSKIDCEEGLAERSSSDGRMTRI
jgi:rhamnogalacturonyl hydrolase YesR